MPEDYDMCSQIESVICCNSRSKVAFSASLSCCRFIVQQGKLPIDIQDDNQLCACCTTSPLSIKHYRLQSNLRPS